jgi:hypothetical protein
VAVSIHCARNPLVHCPFVRVATGGSPPRRRIKEADSNDLTKLSPRNCPSDNEIQKNQHSAEIPRSAEGSGTHWTRARHLMSLVGGSPSRLGFREFHLEGSVMFAFVHRIIADVLCGASAFMVRPKRRRQNPASGGFDSLEPRLLMTVRIWDGSATLNDNWFDARNGVGEEAPVSGDDLIFSAGIGLLDRGTKNDLPFATFKSIEIPVGRL